MKSLTIAFAAVLLAWTLVAQETPDLILFNGRVFTGDAAKPWAAALAIRGNRITAVGTTEQIAQLAESGTKRIDLHNHLVIPGINVARTHQRPIPENFSMSTSPESTGADVTLAVISGADESPASLWLIGTIGPRALKDPTLTAAALDKAAPGRRVMLTSVTGHGYVFSTAALNALRIREDTSDPAGGWFERDASGHLTGKAFEYAGWNAERAVADSATDADAVAALRDFALQALRYGITSVQNISTLRLTRYEKSVRHADVPLRIRMIRFSGTDANGRGLTEGKNLPANDRERKLSVISGTEWILDGTPIEEGAALRRPYHSPSESSGRLNFPPAEISKMLTESLDSNDQLLLHVVGDRTAAAVFDAMRAIPGVDWKSKRVRFEHGDGLNSDLIPAARSLGIVVVQSPADFAAADLYPALDYMPLKSLLRAGIHLALGSDGELNPYVNILIATTFPARRSEAISRQEAVEAYTKGSAFAEFSENEKGTIAGGKLADVAVLSQDIFKVPAEDLPDTVSLLTIVDGRIVYEGGPLDAPAPTKFDPRIRPN